MSLISRAAKLARSPQGRKVVEEGKRLARDPETKRKLDQARKRLASKR